MSDEQITAEATPAGELRRQILSQCVAKNEREWWAARTIEKLEFELNAANDRIKRLDEFVDQLTNPKFTRDDLPKEALLQRIKRLEDAGDAMIAEPCEYTFEQWIKAKEAKL